jgi:hypothetical protein
MENIKIVLMNSELARKVENKEKGFEYLVKVDEKKLGETTMIVCETGFLEGFHLISRGDAIIDEDWLLELFKIFKTKEGIKNFIEQKKKEVETKYGIKLETDKIVVILEKILPKVEKRFYFEEIAILLKEKLNLKEDVSVIIEFLEKEKSAKEIQKETIINTLDDSINLLPASVYLRKVKLIHEASEKQVGNLGEIKIIPKYKVYEAEIVKDGKKRIIFTEPSVNLLSGTFVVLKPISLSTLIFRYREFFEEYLLAEIRKKIKKKKTEKVLLAELEEAWEKYEAYIHMEKLPDELIDEVLKIPNSLNDIFDRMIERDKIDERIFYSIIMSVINFSAHVVPELQRYQCHTIIVTNTKAFKTTLALKFFGPENLYNSARASRLLGYSTAEEVYPSDLEDKIEPTFFDELKLKNFEQYFFDTLLNLMENGVSTIGKGAKTLVTRTLTRFVFMSNVQNPQATQKDLASQLDDFLKLFSLSSQPIGSRIGLLLFGNDFKTVEGNVSIDEKSIFLFKQICKKISVTIDESLRKYKEIINWLETRDKEYEVQIDLLIKSLSQAYESVIGFLQGHKEAYRHLNGGALLLAFIHYFLENQHTLRTGEIDLQTLRKHFEHWGTVLKEWNLQSFRKLIDCFKSEIDEKTYYLLSFKKLFSYLQLFIILVGKALKEGKIIAESYNPIRCLEEHLNSLPQEWKKSYTHISKLVEKIQKRLEDANILLKPFDVEIKEIEGELFFRVKSEKCKKVFEYLDGEKQINHLNTDFFI